MKKFTLLILWLFVIEVSVSYGQFTKLYDFPTENDLDYSEYSQPVFDGTWLYDVSSNGGVNRQGCIFKVKPDGTGYTKLLDFDNTNGNGPLGSLTLSGSTLYGMTYQGGSYFRGTIFKINTDGTGYTRLLDFDGTTKGELPYGSLTLSGSILYGMTLEGGVNDVGTIFKINIDGTGYTKLLDFAGTTNGSNPRGSLTLSGSILYGMTSNGGSNNYGTIFKISTDGSGYTKLLDFNGTANGSNPFGSLALSGSILYGTTFSGGANNQGTIFKVSNDGTGYTKLLDFAGTTNGSSPYGSLTLSGSVLYGMTAVGGSKGPGTIFKINTDGSGFLDLFDFDGAIDGSVPYGSLSLFGSVLFGTTSGGGVSNKGVMFKINTDGSSYTKILDYSKAIGGYNPQGSLVVSGSEMYGMTRLGGTNGLGSIFRINSDGTGYTKLLDFDGATNGSRPFGSLSISGSTLYGMTFTGGTNDNGTIFKINSDGSGYTKLLDFDFTTNGSNPCSSLTVSGSILYGTTFGGGANGNGTIFKINTDGTGYNQLMDFAGTINGNEPHCTLALSGSVLYGTTYVGGTNGNGTIFKINTDGSGYTKLLDFNGTSNGRNPGGSLTISGSILYGITVAGGTNDQGTIFKINTDGTGYSKLQDLDNLKGNTSFGSLVLSGSVLYGMAQSGGTGYNGTFFKINTDGTGFKKLQDFNGINGSYPDDLVLDGNTLYGITREGGTMHAGVIFKYDICTPPTTQASNFTTSGITDNSMTANWTRGDGAGVLVVARKGSAVNADPEDGTIYTANATFGSGPQIGTGNYVVYYGSGTSVNVTNLTPGTGYYYAIYEYSATKGYKIPPLVGNAATTGICIAGSNQCDEYIENVTLGTINNTSSCISGGYADYTAMSTDIAQGSSLVISITNGVPYSDDQCGIWVDWNDNDDFSDDPAISVTGTPGRGPYSAIITCPSGASLGSKRVRVRIMYFGIVSPCGNSSWGEVEDYTINVTPPCTLPTAQATGFVTSLLTGNSMTIGCTRGNGNEVLVVARAGGAVNADPISGIIYSANAALGSGSEIGTGNFVVYKGSGASVNITGLISETAYYYAIYEYTSASNCYLTPALTGNASTIAIPMTYVSSTSTQNNTLSVLPNTNNVEVIGFKVVTEGSLTPIELTQIKMSMDGTTSIGDVSAIKLYYTSGSSTFATTNQVGNLTPAIGEINIGTSTTLIQGVNYFWIAYDVKSTAILNNRVDASLVGATVGGIQRIPTLLNPGDGRPITVYCNTSLGGGSCPGDITLLSISNTSLNNTIHGNCSNANSSIYASYSPVGSNTCNLILGSTYTINVTTSMSDIVSLWIDYDQSGTFDASEWTQVSTNTTIGTPSSITFTVANTAIIGQTGLRIRSRSYGNPNNAINACSSFGSGITEDYTINLAIPCPEPNVGAILQPTCSVSTGSVVLNGLPSTGTWTLIQTPGGATTIGSGASTTISGLAVGTYTYTVTNGLGVTSAASANVIIEANPDTPVTPSLGIITQPTCSLATGSVILNGLPTTGTWTLTRGPEGTTTTGTGASTTISGIASGTYTYTVTNALGCTSGASSNVVINAQPLTPTAPVIGTITQPTIAVTTGSVVLNDLPATGTWTLTRTPGAVTSTGTGTSSTIAGLATGTYTYTVTNASGCTSGASANIVINVQPTSGIDDGNSQVANSLSQNYPNPFDRSTTIEFSIVKPSQVNLSLYNTLGKEVDIIVNEFLTNGTYTKRWEPKNLPEGIYYYQLRVESFKATRRLIILK